MNSADTHPPRSRGRFWIILLGIMLVPVIAIVGLLWYSGYAAEADLKAAIAATDQKDPNWRLTQIEDQRPVLTDDENAALQVLKVRALTRGNYGNAPTFYPLFEGLTPEHQLNGPQLAALEAEHKKNEQAVAEARKLADFKQGRYPVAYSPDFITTATRTQDTREIAQLLADDVRLQAQHEDVAGAVRSWRALWIVGRSIDDEPTVVSMLIRIAIESMSVNALQRLLAQTEPSADDLAKLQELMEQDAGQSLWLIGLRGERAGCDMMIENMPSSQMQRQKFLAAAVGLSGGMPVKENAELMLPGAMERQRAGMLREMTEVIAIARKPPHEWKAALVPVEARMPSLPMLVRLLLPSAFKIADADLRRFAQRRCAIVAVAAERYRLAHRKWPESINVLVKAGLLKEAPLDPYDGKPLKLKWLPDGSIVYSIGPDNQDNNGKRDPQNPITTGTDITFRLWNPTSRRQPPKPVPPMDAPGVPTPGLAPPP